MDQRYLFPDNLISEKDIPSSVVETEQGKNRPDLRTVLKHTALFVLTFICVSLTGLLWVGHTANNSFSLTEGMSRFEVLVTYLSSILEMLPEGMLFASLLLAFLTVHEFGHYFAAVIHNVKVTLPYFIPVPFGIGTLGAVIRIKERVQRTRSLFDIGVSGPVAGFIVSLMVLIYGFATLPDPSFIENFAGHEDVIAHINETGTFPPVPEQPDEGSMIMILGNTLLYDFIAGFFNNVPPMYEMYHYPFLFAGWLGLFFTALNLIPVGQLDGGHILYSLIGYKKHRAVARICFGAITMFAGIEALPLIYSGVRSYSPELAFLSVGIWGIILLFLMRRGFHGDHSWIAPVWFTSLAGSILWLIIFENGIGADSNSGSLIWLLWSFFIVFFVGLEHPPVLHEEKLSPGRRAVGWASMVIFILCISPVPIYFIQ